jgi:hypothetical protein
LRQEVMFVVILKHQMLEKQFHPLNSTINPHVVM